MTTTPRVHRRTKSAGQTLVIAMIILGVLLALGFVFLGIVGRNVQQSASNRQRSAAAELAEAGIRFAHQQLLHTNQGADYRPTPTTLSGVAGNPDITRDPDALYLRPGTGLGLRSDTDTQLDEGGPDGLGPYSRWEYPNGRVLVRIRFAPSDANIFSNQATGPLRNPGRARMYTIIESVGRPGRLTFNDPTSLNSGNAVQFQNYANGAAFRQALGLMRKFDSQIVLSSKAIAFASIGIIETARYITDKFQVSRAADIGISGNLGQVYKGVNVATGRDVANNLVTVPLVIMMGFDLTLYNLGSPPTPTASGVGLGGSFFSNADVRVSGNVYTKLNAALGEIWGINGLLYGADDLAHLDVERNTYDPTTGAWQAPVVVGLENGTNPNLNSRSPQFSTVFGQIRDGIAQTDADGYQRGIGRKEPPSASALDPDTGVSRYVNGTMQSGSLVGTGNSGRFGYGSGPYINNFADRQMPADERGRAQVGSSQSLAYDWLNPNNNQPNSGWQGAFYVPRGAYLHLLPDGFTIDRDAKAPASQRYWLGPDGNPPKDSAGNEVQTGSIRYRLGLGTDGRIHIVNSFTPLDATKSIDINASTINYDLGPVFNGVLYFEGNVRVRGVIPTDVQLTIVSGATIYIEGSITKGVTDSTGARLNRPSKSMAMLIAHDYVALNTTQFFGPATSQTLEEVNDTQSSIAYNPVRMRVGGAPLRFITEMPLDPGASPTNPSAWRPYALDYNEFTAPGDASGAPIPSMLLLTHTMDDGPAPATYISMDVNNGFDPQGLNTTPPVWTYNFPLSPNNAATQPYLDQFASPPYPTHEPIYGLGVETWQRYSRFESIGFPLVENTFTWDTAQGYVMEGNGSNEGSYALRSEGSNEFSIYHNNVGVDPTNDYLLARIAVAPADVRIEASIFAEDGSFFVIPGPPFNPNPNDRRDVFDQAVNNYGGFGSAAAIQQAQRERQENFGSFPEAPFYGEPLDVRITIEGAISENMPPPMDQQSQWIRRWGWIPGQLGALYDFSGPTPRPIMIPRSHVPAGYDLRPTTTNAALFVPNLIISYDPVLATARVNGFDPSPANPVIRSDEYGRTLPPLPRLPVSPTLAYFGEVNP